MIFDDYLCRAALAAQSLAVARDTPTPRLTDEVRALVQGTVEDRYIIALQLAASYLRDAAECIQAMECAQMRPSRRTVRSPGNELDREDGFG